MTRMFVVAVFAIACGFVESNAQDQDKKERTGTVVGQLKSRMPSKDGRSAIIELLGDGEVRTRVYLVAYNPKDPKAKGPFTELLAAVNAAKIGDRVQCTWANSPKGSEGGFFVTAFEVLKKTDDKKDRKEPK